MYKSILLLLTFGLAQALFCQDSTTKKLDELMKAYGKVNKFNGSVLVSQNGRLLLNKGYGYKEARQNLKNDPNSIFQIYSVTKTFTSTLILKLAEQNKVKLTDKLSTFYPGFPHGDSITIEHLLTHTSGVYDYTHGNNMPDLTEKSFIDFLKSKPLDFSPGTGWSYSNSGYWLLGFIIQKVTGITYEQAIKQYIFEPLKMVHSGFDFKNLRDKNKTTGYEIFSEQTKKEAEVYPAPGPFAAGAIYSTTADLYKYYKGLQTFKIITKESLEKAAIPLKNNYGYGWMINDFEGKKLVSHSGGAAGYRSNFVRLPDNDICIVLLDNTENANLERITRNILSILFNKPYKLLSEIKVSDNLLDKYVGYYSVNPRFSMHIWNEAGRLAAQARNQGKTIALAQKPNYFYAEEADGFLEFVDNGSGLFNELIIHQQGQNISASRYHPSWGLIGSATSKGWNDQELDIEMLQDSSNKQIWKANKVKFKKGEFKFRFDNDWNTNYGDNGNDQFLEEFGENIKIEEGLYDIILDLTVDTKPKYKIVRTD